ncbi:hypothetical protein OU997_04245 [Pseudomonas sp. SL4(2022)]|uniref:hypothetical protein n=1 Tax=Pseudomonas sp. SL4(2022) TaxID=2994661 RepID=UPI00227021BA|nr:hypothetical protein [Pseudomonas sp. SL4(2022)]WAC45408.1 hypothetical protein OU997_04245 [Pseudomonas sp. SL4(2022)]
MSQVNGDVRRYGWRELSTAPEESGVYAWYARLLISSADLNDFTENVSRLSAEGIDPRSYVGEALERLIFRRYHEDNYQVTVSGPLKPRYVGEAAHQVSLSQSLIERLCLDPSRLGVIAETLSVAAPAFTAPLYIGMATSIRERLMKHKALIEKLRDAKSRKAADEMTDGDAGFARQIVARQFDPTNLFVHVRLVKSISNEHVDIENVLNRINFPIFGRN